MSYSDLAAKAAAAVTNTAAVTPPDGSSSGAGKTLKYGTPSSQQTGRLSGSGIDVVSRTPIAASPSTIDPAAANLPISSNFPYNGTDTFLELTNDAGVIAQSQDFNALVSAVRTVEAYTGHILRYAPIDLTDRLASGARYLNGVDTTGSVDSSHIRRPKTVTLGTSIAVTGNPSSATATTLALSTAQKTALGMTSTVEALSGLTWRTGAKLQKTTIDLSTIDAAACVGRTEARVDSNGTVQLYLCPGPYIPTTFGDANLYAGNGGTPYLATGTWYVYITFYLSPYIWP